LRGFRFLISPFLMLHATPRALHSLRHSSLRRWVALVFLLSVAAAYASPIVQPRSLELLCSTNGAMKLINQAADGQEANADVMHCGLCAPAAAPPPVGSYTKFYSALGYAAQRTPASSLAALTRPPLPPRGPPAFS
jgi:hypothetical protein